MNSNRWISWLLTLALMMGLCSPLGGLLPAVKAVEIVAQGDTSVRGDIHWELDSEGTFTLSGDGRPPMVVASMRVTPWDDYKDQIRRVVIEEGVWHTGEYSFSDCTNLTEVELASSVTQIGDSAFSRCTGLTSIQFPSNLEGIGRSAFSGCTGLTDLRFPNSLEHVNSWAFSGCVGLSDVIFPSNTTVGMQAFASCKGLQRVVLPDKNAIGQYAFIYCTSLKEVYWPLAVTYSDGYFYGGSGQLVVYYEGSQEEWEAVGKRYLGEKVPEGTTVYYNCDMPLRVVGEETADTDSSIPTPILENLTCTAEGVSISWTLPLVVPGETHTVDGFYILRKVPDGSFQKIGETTGTIYTDTTAEEGRTYVYTVQAHYQKKTGSYDAAGLSIVFRKPKEESEWTPSAAVNSYVQDHVWFAESDDFDERMDHRFAASIAEAQNSSGQMAAEIAYDLLNTADEATNFQRLTLFDNPYDALMVELLSNLANTESVTVALESEMVELCDSVLDLIYKVQPDYKPSDTFSTDLMDLFTEPESFQKEHGALYDTLKSAIDSSVKEVGREKTLNALLAEIEDVEGFATVLAVVGDGLELVDWFADSSQYYLLVETYVNLGESTRDVLWNAASKMSGLEAVLFRAALAKYEQYMTADNLAAAFMKGGDIAVDLGGRLYDMVGAPAAAFLATKYVTKLTGATVNVPLAAYHLGWAVSNAITNNDQLILSRTMIRANYYMEQAVYNILQENRTALLQNPNANTALAFDAAYTLLRQCEIYALQEYQNYLDASQKSMVQGILHLGNVNSNSYEIAIADREIIDWKVTACHGSRVSDQHLGSNLLTINGASEVVLRDGSGNILLKASGDKVTEYGSSVVTGRCLSEALYYLGVYANGVYQLQITPKAGERLVVLYAQMNADNQQLRIDDYVISGASKVTGTLNAEVYGGGEGELILRGETGAIISPVKQIDNGEQMIMVKGISLEGKTQSTVAKGQSFRLEPQIQPSLPELFWSSSNPAVATVDNTGLVTPLSAGTATIVAQAMDGSGCRLVYELTVDGTLSVFSDVPADSWYYDAVQWAVENGVTSGTSPTTFSPNRACTRAEVVTLLWRALGLDELSTSSNENPFRDVPANTFYRDAVLWAAENGITTGTSATAFSPNGVCTRAQVVTFLWRADFPLKQLSGAMDFNDVERSDFFWYPVKWAVEEEITTGTSTTTFSPSLTCTRAQVVTFLYRFFSR